MHIKQRNTHMKQTSRSMQMKQMKTRSGIEINDGVNLTNFSKKQFQQLEQEYTVVTNEEIIKSGKTEYDKYYFKNITVKGGFLSEFLSDITFKGCIFETETAQPLFDNIRIQNCEFTNVTFINVTISDVTFNGCIIDNVNFMTSTDSERSTTLKDCSFESSFLKNISFVSSTLENIKFINLNNNKRDDNKRIFSGFKFIYGTLTNVDFSGFSDESGEQEILYIYKGIIFDNATLNNVNLRYALFVGGSFVAYYYLGVDDEYSSYLDYIGFYNMDMLFFNCLRANSGWKTKGLVEPATSTTTTLINDYNKDFFENIGLTEYTNKFNINWDEI